MIIIPQKVELLKHDIHPYKFIEKVARTCYKSEDKITDNSAEKMVAGLCKSGHYAMLEHEYLYFSLSFSDKDWWSTHIRYEDAKFLHINGQFISGSFRAFKEFFEKCESEYSPHTDGKMLVHAHRLYPLIFGVSMIEDDVDEDGVFLWNDRELFISAMAHYFDNKTIMKFIPHTLKFTTSRAIANELVRHRPAAFCITGDTVLRSLGQKRWTVEQLFDWQDDKKRKGRLKLMKLRSVDENTNTVVPNTIKKIIKLGERPCFELITESGRKLKCTAEHPIYTPSGYKELQDLSVGDYVYANGLELLDNKDWLEDFYIKKNHTRKETAAFIGCCESLVWKSCKKFNIIKPHSNYPNRQPGHGKKGAMSETAKQKLKETHLGSNNPQWIEDRSKITDSTGHNEAWKRYHPDKCELCGVTDKLEIHHINVNPKDNRPENIMFLCQRCHHLWHRHGAIGVFKDKIVSIKPIGNHVVYDIEMNEPYHNFVANSIVVHNCQESQRYVDYSKDKANNQITVIQPMIHPTDILNYENWHYAMVMAECQYMNLRKGGMRPEIARGVLPNDCKTEIVVTATEEEWQHIINLRYHGTTGTPHPQMRELMQMAYPILQEESNDRIQ